MGSEINTRPPPQPAVDPVPPPQAANTVKADAAADAAASQAEQQAKQTQQDQAADQADHTQQAQTAAELQKLAQQQLMKAPDKPQALSTEFMSAFETIFQEGYENYKVPQSSEGAQVFADLKGKEFQKDLSVIREFIREAKYLIGEQGMDMSQMFHWIRSEQGGQFWQKVQQALQHAMPGQVRPDAETAMLGAKPGGGALKDGDPDKIESSQHPGKAMLDLLKAESNPRSQFESYAAILLTLRQEGLKESSQRMANLLKRRWDLSDEDLNRMMAQYGMVYYQGGAPREKGPPVNWWYFIGAVIAVPSAMVLGFDFLWAAGIGVAVAVLVLAFVRFSGK